MTAAQVHERVIKAKAAVCAAVRHGGVRSSGRWSYEVCRVSVSQGQAALRNAKAEVKSAAKGRGHGEKVEQTNFAAQVEA